MQTSYLIAEIIVIPLSGWLSRVMSTRWLFCVSAAGFTVTSLLCGWAWDIESMIVFRALQGFLGGSMIPTVFTAAFAFFPGPQTVDRRRHHRRLASLAPTLGPDGRRLDHRQLLLALAVLRQPRARRSFVAVVVPLLVRIDKPDLSLLQRRRLSRHGADGDLPRLPRIHAGGGAALGLVRRRHDPRLTAWIARDRRRRLRLAQPDLRPARSSTCARCKSRNFALGCFFSFVTGIGIFATIYLTPLFLGRVRGFSALRDRPRGLLDRRVPGRWPSRSTPAARGASTCAG